MGQIAGIAVSYNHLFKVILRDLPASAQRWERSIRRRNAPSVKWKLPKGVSPHRFDTLIINVHWFHRIVDATMLLLKYDTPIVQKLIRPATRCPAGSVGWGVLFDNMSQSAAEPRSSMYGIVSLCFIHILWYNCPVHDPKKVINYSIHG